MLEHSGLKVSSLYIAQVKQKCGIIERENYNKPKPEDARQPQCPPEKEKAIIAALGILKWYKQKAFRIFISFWKKVAQQATISLGCYAMIAISVNKSLSSGGKKDVWCIDW